MAEWSKALVLGTSHFDGVGSNPTAAKSFLFFFFFRGSNTFDTGVAAYVVNSVLQFQL